MVYKVYHMTSHGFQSHVMVVGSGSPVQIKTYSDIFRTCPQLSFDSPPIESTAYCIVVYINEINITILLVKSYIMKCKYENIMPSPEAVGKMFSYKVSLLSQVRNIDLWLLLKIYVSELTQNCMLRIIEELLLR